MLLGTPENGAFASCHQLLRCALSPSAFRWNNFDRVTPQTHVGAGSMYEAINAQIPMIMTPQWADQPINTALSMINAMTKLITSVTRLSVGIPLLQFCTGHEGRTFADGTQFVGTPQAMSGEMENTWRRVRGEYGEEMRGKLARLKNLVEGSREDGQARVSLMALGRLLAVE